MVAPQIFKQKMSASWEFDRWGKYDVIKNRAKDLGSSVTNTVNEYGNSIIVNAQNTAYLSYGDAKPLGSTTHPRPDGGSSQSNASSTSIPLDELNLETGMTAIKQQKSGAGKKLNIGNGNLVLQVPETLDKTAIIITGSQKRSGGLYNDLNWYLGKINCYINPFIGSDEGDLDGNAGSDTAWNLFAKGVHGMTLNYDVRPSYKNWENEDSDVMYTKVYASMVIYWKFWYGTWFSKGNNAAYSS